MSDEKHFSIIPGAEPFRLKAKGSKILLIHGFTATPTEVKPIGDYLHKKKYDIYSVLLPGHGTTPEDLQTKKLGDWKNSISEIFAENNGFDFVIGCKYNRVAKIRFFIRFFKKFMKIFFTAYP